MKSLYIFTLFLFAFGITGHGAEFEKYGNTNWMVEAASPDGVSIHTGSIVEQKGKKAVLVVQLGTNGKWQAQVISRHFLVTNKEGVGNAILNFKAKKPFSITGRNINSYVDCIETNDGNLLFYWCNGVVVNWLVSKELVEVSIEEMGGTQKVFTFDTHGLKEVMLEAQRRQRALK